MFWRKFGITLSAICASAVVLYGIGAGVNWLMRAVPVKQEAAVQHETETAGEQAADTMADPARLAKLLAVANADAGAVQAKRCANCHSYEKGAVHKIGPNLFGIVGRPVARVSGFNFSPGMVNHKGQWDFALLDCYLKAPKACLPGNRMAHPGVKDEIERANIIMFLRSLSDAPVPLPTS